MKFTSIFFKTNASILEIYLKDQNKRARNIKLFNIFQSERKYLGDLFQDDYHKVVRTNSKVKPHTKEK